ncbi:hypothetical protein ONE63_001507 [Megalurothrips usitatus]|uniref:Uncharacterized protein n=1 Tax=Megalurothrips usitatus TaxID=439358 RepID=A0AAV7XDD1_9NEOP|nr:hypothetical protein ONE63_001507 [Megalurothrips usitatus]
MASTAAAVKRLDALFRDVRVSDDDDGGLGQVTVELSADRNCDVHGLHQHGGGRRGSLGNILRTRRNSVSPRRDSVPHTTYLTRRRDSIGGLGSLSPLPKESLDHPSAFPTTLRRESTAGGVLAPRPGLPGDAGKRRFSTDSLDGRRNSWDPSRRGSSSSSGGWDDPLWEERAADVKVHVAVVVVAVEAVTHSVRAL